MMDLALKIKQQESSASWFDEPVVVWDKHGKAVFNNEIGDQKNYYFSFRKAWETKTLSVAAKTWKRIAG